MKPCIGRRKLQSCKASATGGGQGRCQKLANNTTTVLYGSWLIIKLSMFSSVEQNWAEKEGSQGRSWWLDEVSLEEQKKSQRGTGGVDSKSQLPRVGVRCNQSKVKSWGLEEQLQLLGRRQLNHWQS